MFTVRGWAIDPDTDAPIGIHAYVAGSGSAHVADSARRDLAAVFPAYGDAHGFVIQRTLPKVVMIGSFRFYTLTLDRGKKA